MKGLILRWVLNACGLLLISYLFDGIHVTSVGRAFLAALVLGIMNALVRPVVLVLTLPLNILTMGLFTLVVNGLMLWLTGNIIKGFEVVGFWSAVGGALVMSLISLAANSLIGDRGTVEVIEMRRGAGGVWRDRY